MWFPGGGAGGPCGRLGASLSAPGGKDTARGSNFSRHKEHLLSVGYFFKMLGPLKMPCGFTVIRE